MGKFVLLVQSQPRPGQETEYHRWYEQQHIPDILAVAGVKSAARYAAVPTSFPGPEMPYLAIYEIECDDPQALMAEMDRRGAAGLMPVSDAIDVERVKVWMYQHRPF
jgi:hypothetical protein